MTVRVVYLNDPREEFEDVVSIKVEGGYLIIQDETMLCKIPTKLVSYFEVFKL